MANPFLNNDCRDVETAIMLEQAFVHDIGKAVAYTDGDRVFINTEDNLFDLLPAYDNNMLKWLLWHERYHKELRHHNRFFRYLKELSEQDTEDEFHVTKEEVNIIMDILVHDSLAKLFPDLVETAVNNLAQMRNRNSLEYTFKTFTLEKMLEEYAKHKKGEDDGEGTGEGAESPEKKSDDTSDDTSSEHGGSGDTPAEPPKDKPEEPKKDKKEDSKEEDNTSKLKGHSRGGRAKRKKTDTMKPHQK